MNREMSVLYKFLLYHGLKPLRKYHSGFFSIQSKCWQLVHNVKNPKMTFAKHIHASEANDDINKVIVIELEHAMSKLRITDIASTLKIII